LRSVVTGVLPDSTFNNNAGDSKLTRGAIAESLAVTGWI
jgi:hypothetical protein